jgi:valyl-tRNA synthetase
MLQNSNDFLTVATTRPETMFVDTCIFVNPKDKRYTSFIGKTVVNPINGQSLTVMADTYIDPQFGTGVMKCTPAHDFNDYQLAIKYKMVGYQSVIQPNGTLNKLAQTKYSNYEGQDRLIARKNIVADMQRDNLVVKIEDHTSEIGYSERTGEIIEPLLSKQWFIKMNPIIKEVTALLKKQKPNYIPPRFEKAMMHWLNNMNDWCISRQLL